MGPARSAAFCLAATLACGCAGDDADRPAVTERPALDRMAEYVHSEGAPGVALLVRNRSGTWRAASGLAVVDPPRPLRGSDRFRVASVTKTFTATVVLQLVGEGRIALDDRIDRRLPRVIPPRRAITIRQLLNHTSGLYDFVRDRRFQASRLVRNPRLVVSPREQISIALDHPQEFRPGTDWGYSNTGYEVLGLLVERVTGQPLGRVLARRIFEPLGLRATSFEEAPRVPPSTAHGYALPQVGPAAVGDAPRDVAESLDGGVWADGAIVSTPDDLATFYGALLGRKLLDPELLAEMTRTVPGDLGASGLGLFRYEVSCGAAWGHGGSMVGYLTQVFAGRDGGHIVVVVATGNTVRIASAMRATAAAAYCTS
jgi:D-alanyl-D-alanine carboxypeptidase